MTSAAMNDAPAEENTPLNATELEDWHAWCVKWDSLQGKRLYATIMSARARAEAAEAESARLLEKLCALSECAAVIDNAKSRHPGVANHYAVHCQLIDGLIASLKGRFVRLASGTSE